MNILLLLALLGAPPEPPGRLCIAPADADFDKAAICSESPLRRIPVAPSTERRRFVWTSPARQDLVLGIALPGDAEIVLGADRAGALQLQLDGAKNREWPVPATVTLREPSLGEWKFTLGAQQVVHPVTLRMPRGTYDVDVVAAGHRLFSKKAVIIGQFDLRPAILHAVLTAQPRLTATVFAKAERVPFARLHAGSRICESSADGRLLCELPDDVPDTVRIDHPQFGGRTIAIDRRMTDLELGNVELRRGGTVIVERPPDVELPERTFGRCSRPRGTGGRSPRSASTANRPSPSMPSIPATTSSFFAGPSPPSARLSPFTSTTERSSGWRSRSSLTSSRRR